MEIIKIRVNINHVGNRKRLQKVNETQSWFFEMVNKIDKPFERRTKKSE
jgi:hypothetical protein